MESKDVLFRYINKKENSSRSSDKRLTSKKFIIVVHEPPWLLDDKCNGPTWNLTEFDLRKIENHVDRKIKGLHEISRAAQEISQREIVLNFMIEETKYSSLSCTGSLHTLIGLSSF